MRATLSPAGADIDANCLKLRNDFKRPILSFHAASAIRQHEMERWVVLNVTAHPSRWRNTFISIKKKLATAWVHDCRKMLSESEPLS